MLYGALAAFCCFLSFVVVGAITGKASFVLLGFFVGVIFFIVFFFISHNGNGKASGPK